MERLKVFFFFFIVPISYLLIQEVSFFCIMLGASGMNNRDLQTFSTYFDAHFWQELEKQLMKTEIWRMRTI